MSRFSSSIYDSGVKVMFWKLKPHITLQLSSSAERNPSQRTLGVLPPQCPILPTFELISSSTKVKFVAQTPNYFLWVLDLKSNSVLHEHTRDFSSRTQLIRALSFDRSFSLIIKINPWFFLLKILSTCLKIFSGLNLFNFM